MRSPEATMAVDTAAPETTSETTTPETPERTTPREITRRRGLRWWRVALAAFVVLLVAEAGARLVASGLEPVTEWPDTNLERHEDQLAAMDNEIDLLVLGSSSAGVAVRPHVLVEDGLAERGYSYWQAGAPMRAIDMLASEVLLHRTSPRTVIIGITMREFNDADGQASVVRDLEGSTAFRAATGRRSLVDRLDDFLQEHSELARRRALLRKPTNLIDALRAPDPPFVELGTDGYLAGRGANVLAEEPAEHVQQERAAMVDYTVSDVEVAALAHLLDELAARNIEALVVNLPVTDEFISFAPNGSADYQRYVETVRAVALSKAHWLDTMSLTWDDADFGDVNHLNDRGAQRLRPIVADAVSQMRSG